MCWQTSLRIPKRKYGFQENAIWENRFKSVWLLSRKKVYAKKCLVWERRQKAQ